MWLNKLPCTIPGWQQCKLFTISLFILEASAALLSSVRHFVHVNSELRSIVRESVPQTNYSELRSRTFWSCAPSTHPKTVFYHLSRCCLGLKVHFELTIFLLSGQNVTCTRSFVLQSDWYCQSKAPEVDNFFCRCSQALSSPPSPFLRREPGDEAISSHSARSVLPGQCCSWPSYSETSVNPCGGRQCQWSKDSAIWKCDIVVSHVPRKAAQTVVLGWLLGANCPLASSINKSSWCQVNVCILLYTHMLAYW